MFNILEIHNDPSNPNISVQYTTFECTKGYEEVKRILFDDYPTKEQNLIDVLAFVKDTLTESED